jgi:hypothetical protein
MKILKLHHTFLFCFFLFFLTSCRKFVDIDPPITSVSTESAFKDDETGTAVITGLYSRLFAEFTKPGLSGLSYYTELSADNLILANPSGFVNLSSYYQNTYEPRYTAVGGASYWTNTYSLLFTINSSIESLSGNKEMSMAVSKRLLGEAYFLRAFCYFYLTNIYGDVPLVLISNRIVSATLKRSPASDVYTQILADLSKAEGLLNSDYVGADVTQTTTERLRPNLFAVYALQARTYLYQKNYPAAEAAATKVISQTTEYSLGPLQGVFLANSSETIWALQSITAGINTREGAIYVLPKGGPDRNHPVYASTSLMNSFEPGDDRENKWTDSVSVTVGTKTTVYHYPAKYKVTTIAGSTTLSEYEIVFRLAEQYLIRAEARNEQSNTTGTIDDLNALRTRSRAEISTDIPDPLPDLTSSLTQVELRTKIMHERQVELFTEWSHRWFDLKRTNTIDAVMAPATALKGGIWASYKALYPVPLADILLDPALTQNPGYTN